MPDEGEGRGGRFGKSGRTGLDLHYLSWDCMLSPAGRETD